MPTCLNAVEYGTCVAAQALVVGIGVLSIKGIKRYFEDRSIDDRLAKIRSSSTKAVVLCFRQWLFDRPGELAIGL